MRKSSSKIVGLTAISMLTLLSFFLLIPDATPAPSGPLFDVEWTEEYSGVGHQVWIVTIQNLDDDAARDFNVELLINSTNFPPARISNVEIDEWKIIETTFPTFETIQHTDTFGFDLNDTIKSPTIPSNCQWTEENVTYICFRNETTQSGTIVKDLAQWKRSKMQLVSHPGKVTADYGNINIPKFNSKAKVDDFNIVETINGTKTLRISFDTPIILTGAGWGSSGMIGIFDFITGNFYHPWWDVSFGYRYECLSSASTPTIISCNDTEGIDGNVYWMKNATAGTGKIYVYCENQGCVGGDKAFANDTTEINWQNDSVTTEPLEGNNVEDMWRAESAAFVLHMEMLAGFFNDSSGQENDAVAIGGQPPIREGVFGSAPYFSGTRLAQTFAGPTGLTFTGGGPSVFAWINSTAIGNTRYIVDVRDGTDHIYFSHVLNGQILCNIYTDAGNAECYSPAASAEITTNQWYHVGCVHNGTHTLVYVNGSMVNACARSGTPVAWDDHIHIGARYNHVSTFQGQIDEVRVYNVTIEPDEVMDMFNNGWDALSSLGVEEEAPLIPIFYNVTLEGPANATATTDNTPDFTFRQNSSFDGVSCELFVNGTGHGINSSVSNDTSTTITANASIPIGTATWYVNCTNSTTTQQSDATWQITIDAAARWLLTLIFPLPGDADQRTRIGLVRSW